MQNIKLIMLLITFLPIVAQAQQQSKSSKQTRTIEINNENGNLYISFADNDIKEFTVNDEPVEQDQYENYQAIIDDFSDDDSPATPIAPTPTPPVAEDYHSETIRTMLIDYLSDSGLITSEKKFKVELKSKHLKVNGKKLSQEAHQDCLNLFDEVYGHPLNTRSVVKFKKSKRNSSSSISIVN